MGGTEADAPRAEQPIRAAEIVGALSLATDLGTGQPLEHALRTAALAVRLGELAGASGQELADTYYVALLHSAGSPPMATRRTSRTATTSCPGRSSPSWIPAISTRSWRS